MVVEWEVTRPASNGAESYPKSRYQVVQEKRRIEGNVFGTAERNYIYIFLLRV